MTVRMIQGDCTEVIPDFGEDVDLTFTSPPYYDAVNYADETDEDVDYWEREDEDLSDYLKLLKECFCAIFDETCEGGYLVVNISPVISEGNRIPLHSYLTQRKYIEIAEERLLERKQPTLDEFRQGNQTRGSQ